MIGLLLEISNYMIIVFGLLLEVSNYMMIIGVWFAAGN
jgi:hypothetical protein